MVTRPTALAVAHIHSRVASWECGNIELAAIDRRRRNGRILWCEDLRKVCPVVRCTPDTLLEGVNVNNVRMSRVALHCCRATCRSRSDKDLRASGPVAPIKAATHERMRAVSA